MTWKMTYGDPPYQYGHRSGWWCPNCQTYHSPAVKTCPNVKTEDPWSTTFIPKTDERADCSCPRDVLYVCNNAFCPRSIKITY